VAQLMLVMCCERSGALCSSGNWPIPWPLFHDAFCEIE
jgi:hypothetical protein